MSCTEVGCQSNDDCSYDERCDFQSRKCIPLCAASNICAQGARCEANNHKETCTCNYPLQGDGYTSCLPRKETSQISYTLWHILTQTQYFAAYEPGPQPECRVDSDCPSKLACIREECQNPCIIGNPCSATQTCVVTDTLPSRSVACICPARMVPGPNGECKSGNSVVVICKSMRSIGLQFPIACVLVEAKAECYSDSDCQFTEVCHQGSCADACQVTKCGANARCEASFHSAKCLCPSGYTGNPEIACTPCK